MQKEWSHVHLAVLLTLSISTSQFPLDIIFQMYLSERTLLSNGYSSPSIRCQGMNRICSSFNRIYTVDLLVSPVYMYLPTCTVLWAPKIPCHRISLHKTPLFLDVHISILLSCQTKQWSPTQQKTRVCQPKAFGKVLHTEEKPLFTRNKHLSSKFDRRCEVRIFFYSLMSRF